MTSALARKLSNLFYRAGLDLQGEGLIDHFGLSWGTDVDARYTKNDQGIYLRGLVAESNPIVLTAVPSFIGHPEGSLRKRSFPYETKPLKSFLRYALENISFDKIEGSEKEEKYKYFGITRRRPQGIPVIGVFPHALLEVPENIDPVYFLVTKGNQTFALEVPKNEVSVRGLTKDDVVLIKGLREYQPGEADTGESVGVEYIATKDRRFIFHRGSKVPE